MITSTSRNSLLGYLTAQSSSADDSGTSASAIASGAMTPAQAAALAKTNPAALQTAASAPKAATAAHALDKQQATLANDLRAAMGRAGVKLGAAVEFSVASDGKVEIKGSPADKAATSAFLKADTSKPSFATRIATQAKDALTLSSGLQQTAAISQAARYGGKSGGVMALYTSLMQQSGTTPAVFSLGATTSSLTYAGALTAKA